MTPENDKKLTERFPFFQGADSREPFPMFGFECGDGWFDILWRLCEDLETLGWKGYVTQVKEKFGELRFYISGGSEAVFERIDSATTTSLHICEVCGQAGTLDSSQYWLMTLCPVHTVDRAERPTSLWGITPPTTKEGDEP